MCPRSTSPDFWDGPLILPFTIELADAGWAPAVHGTEVNELQAALDVLELHPPRLAVVGVGGAAGLEEARIDCLRSVFAGGAPSVDHRTLAKLSVTTSSAGIGAVSVPARRHRRRRPADTDRGPPMAGSKQPMNPNYWPRDGYIVRRTAIGSDDGATFRRLGGCARATIERPPLRRSELDGGAVMTSTRRGHHKTGTATIAGPRGHTHNEVEVSVGVAQPLGATCTPTGVNFSVYSEHANSVTLLLFDSAGATLPDHEIVLNARDHRSFHFWHNRLMKWASAPSSAKRCW
jgi:hypothetical protein